MIKRPPAFTRPGTPSMRCYDDAVIGAGILGLAHAYHLARRGRKVIVLERDRIAMGASVRNFGMLWPVGQPPGLLRDLAKRSLDRWLEVLPAARLWHKRTGSLHLAYREDEAQVLREFITAAARRGEPFEWVDPARVRGISRLAKQDGLLGGMWSPDEVCVDPREVVAGLPGWLDSELGIEFRFEDPVTDVRAGCVVAASGLIEAGRTWVCSGDELRVLFPDLLSRSGLVRCKLQMMRSSPCGPEEQIGPMLAGGLTLRHYTAFRDCQGFGALKERVARESPSFDRLGIHVMVSQNGLGELTIGDSHEYGNEIEPFDKAEIEHLILDYLGRFLDIPGMRIASRWHGTYAKHPEQPYLVLDPMPGVRVVTGVGGAGMTLSFGLAAAVVEQALGSE